MKALNGSRPRRYLGNVEPPEVRTWLPLGCDDRLYVESLGVLPDALQAELESCARRMRLVVALHGAAISRIELAPW